MAAGEDKQPKLWLKVGSYILLESGFCSLTDLVKSEAGLQQPTNFCIARGKRKRVGQNCPGCVLSEW